MKSKVLFVALALVLVLALAVPAFADGPGASDCGAGYGELHKSLAQQGLTGKAHVPGQAHTGAAGICLGYPGGSGG